MQESNEYKKNYIIFSLIVIVHVSRNLNSFILFLLKQYTSRCSDVMSKKMIYKMNNNLIFFLRFRFNFVLNKNKINQRHS